MNYRRLHIENRNGERLAARLDLPVDGQPIACALFAHCFTCSKNLKAVGAISTALNEQGLAVLRFDFAGLGESEGDFADTNFSSNIEDLLDAAAFLADEYEAPAILIGHSLGGAAVLQAAARLEAVRAVATIGAPYDPEHVAHLFACERDEIEHTGQAEVLLAGRRFTITKQFLDDLQAHRVDQVLGALRKPLLLMHSPVDETVGIENAALIYEAARHPKSFISLDQADHLLTKEADACYVGEVLAAWVRKYLDAPSETVKAGAPDDNRITVHLDEAHYRTEILANGHALVADEPERVGGTNHGPSPYDLLVSALGACTAMTLRMYADHKKWPMETVTVRLLHQKVHASDGDHPEDKGSKVDRITRELTFTGDLTDEQRARLLQIADRCPVHRTLEGDIRIETSLG